MTRLSDVLPAVREGHMRRVRVTPATVRRWERQYPDLAFAWFPRAEADADATWKVTVSVRLAA